ncbi:MAG: FixH family protein [Chitinophagaceae bacterium]|nr:FixH family protein [Chitinophagaceae bacterium]
MTLNWGHKLTIVFILFGALIFTLVYKCFQTDFQLVNKEYYKDELKYQQVIDGTKNAVALSSEVQLLQNEKTITIQFPNEMKGKKLSGQIWFYCSYDDTKDRHIAVSTTDDALQLIQRSRLSSAATYTVKLNWQADEKNYYNEQTITIK